MNEPTLEQDAALTDDETQARNEPTLAYAPPTVVSFSLDPDGIESGDALTANG